MRIAQVVPYFHPHIGGIESFAGNLVKGLVKRSHDVTVITCLHDAELPNKDEFAGASIVRLKPFIHPIGTPVVPRISRTVSGGDFDVVHTHTPPPVSELYAARGAKRSGKPLVISYHGDPEANIRFGSLLSRAYQRTFGIVALQYAKKIIVHTRTYAATSRAIWKYDPVIIPSAVDLERFNPSVDSVGVRRKHGLEGKKVVLFVGRLVATKGIEYFVRSAEYTDKDTTHLIAGDGKLEDETRKLAKALGLEKRVVFAGRVSDDELPAYYAACDLFVLPSVSRLEGFGLVTLEAMATGKTVLVSDIPGVREVIEPGKEGLLIEPMNPKDIAEKINGVLGDDTARNGYGSSARKKAEERYSWNSVISQIEKVYDEAAG